VKSVSGKRLCRILEQAGWVLQRVQGSHHIYSHPDHAAILTVPVHANRDLKKGTLSKLLKEAGLTEDDL
jgi:predicted RNA binding protein YcfA (HicA-like mRNA interferase family)